MHQQQQHCGGAPVHNDGPVEAAVVCLVLQVEADGQLGTGSEQDGLFGCRSGEACLTGTHAYVLLHGVQSQHKASSCPAAQLPTWKSSCTVAHWNLRRRASYTVMSILGPGDVGDNIGQPVMQTLSSAAAVQVAKSTACPAGVCCAWCSLPQSRQAATHRRRRRLPGSSPTRVRWRSAPPPAPPQPHSTPVQLGNGAKRPRKGYSGLLCRGCAWHTVRRLCQPQECCR